jgi:hypothetical protein
LQKKRLHATQSLFLTTFIKQSLLRRFGITISLFFVCAFSTAQTNSLLNNSQSLTTSLPSLQHFEENNFYAASESSKEKSERSDFQLTDFATCTANTPGELERCEVYGVVVMRQALVMM